MHPMPGSNGMTRIFRNRNLVSFCNILTIVSSSLYNVGLLIILDHASLKVELIIDKGERKSSDLNSIDDKPDFQMPPIMQ